MVSLSLIIATGLVTPALGNQTEGSITDLAKLVSNLSKQPGLVLLPSAEKISYLKDAESYELLTDDLKKRGYVSSSAGIGMIYSFGLPTSRHGVLSAFFESAKNAASFAPVSVEPESIKDGNLTMVTKPGTSVFLGSLNEIKDPRPVVVHPYYLVNATDYPMALNLKNVPVVDFLKAVAKGAGGRLQTNQKNYTIDFDSQQFKSNFSKLVAAARKSVEGGRMPKNDGSRGQFSPALQGSKTSVLAALTLLDQTVQAMTPELIEQTFAYAGSRSRLNLNLFRTLQQPLAQYIMSLNSNQSIGKNKNQRGQAAQAEYGTSLLSRVNSASPGFLAITTDFQISAELNVFSGVNASGNSKTSVETVPIL